MKSVSSGVTDLNFPDFTLVTASAGSGKTYTLTQRYLQFILSKHIPQNQLRNILAITFTNNAAREMKQRILENLKKASLGDEEILTPLCRALGEDASEVRPRANGMVGFILDHYTEFQVQTIDSFLSRVFRASALEFGFSPNVEILIDSSPLLRTSFDRFAQELALSTDRRSVLDGLVELMLANQPADSKFLWNPFTRLSEEVHTLYNRLNQIKEDIARTANLAVRKKELRDAIVGGYRELQKLVVQSEAQASKNFEKLDEYAARNDAEGLIKGTTLFKTPINKSGLKKEDYDRWEAIFDPVLRKLKAMADEYTVIGVRSYYDAYVEGLRYFRGVVGDVMKEEERISIGDVNRLLARMVSKDTVPEIYYYLGEQIHHYLIDEFQDTSPLQWDVFRPLAEETLGGPGSLFIVGDTKQSIYTFRGADWQIMNRLGQKPEPFPSAPVRRVTLDTNYRSFQRILDFNRQVFHSIVPSVVTNGAEHLSGLDDYVQNVKPEFAGKGYVEEVFFDEKSQRADHKKKVLEILDDCLARGYALSDVTILTPRNEEVVEISGWLNEAQKRFISHSNLDCRGRKVTGELLALLRFLDSPVNDLPLMTFVLGDVFRAQLDRASSPVTREALRQFVFTARRESEHQGTLYRRFRGEFPDLWQKYFEALFNRVGYLPLYDLVSDVYKSFDLFRLLPDEEASLVKFLEVVKDFEKEGQNSLKDFLAFAEEENDDSDWNIPVPQKMDAVAVMTIHKAKGLGNRVVVVLLKDTPPRPDNLFIETGEDGLHLLRITGTSANADPRFHQLYTDRHVRRAVDDLNKLYVAFTRAEEELYVISVKGRKWDEPSKFLPQTGYEPGEKPKAVRQPPQPQRSIATEHLAARAPFQAVSAGSIGLYERKRGEFIHAILAKLEFVGEDAAERIRNAVNEIELETGGQGGALSVGQLLGSFLRKPEVRTFFDRKDGRTIWNEREFARPDGSLFRMDRLVIDPDSVTVIDFKTGGEDPEYNVQIRGYMNILKEVFSGLTVQGYLAYVDRTLVREVPFETP